MMKMSFQTLLYISCIINPAGGGVGGGVSEVQDIE